MYTTSAYSNCAPSSSYLKCRNVSNLVADYGACLSATINKSAIMHHEQRVPYAQYDPSYENKYGNHITTLSGSSYCSPPDLRNDPMINGVNGNVNIRVWCHDLRQVDLFRVKNRPSQPRNEVLRPRLRRFFWSTRAKATDSNIRDTATYVRSV